MESKKINQLATELTPSLDDLTIIGDPSTGISKKITLSQMAALFTGTVEEYASLAAFPLVGVADTIYIATDTNILYRWSTSLSAYVELSPNIISSLVFNDSNGFDGTISLVGSTATLTITTTLTSGSVAFGGASGALSQDNTNFYWDNSNKRLGINTNAPTVALDAFGSGIIGRVNGTSTNNAYLGFASNGTNRWSIGNVQSDHRFRIYNEATTSELATILSTGEFGIGIANPTTKFHIDGAASALIVNLDANVSIAKSISFRSDNSNRWNIEVSGTESTGNAGMDFFLRSYSDAGALIETPLSIVRSTGVTTIKSLTLTNALSVANGGTGITSYTIGDLIYASGSTTLAKLADVATGNALISGGVGVAPSWGKIDLTTTITGTLPVANGGTGATTFTAGRVLFGNGTSAINTSANLFWDNSNSRLGIGIASPTHSLVVYGGSKPQIVANGGGSFGSGISLYNELTGTGRRNWFIGTEENVVGDFTIKSSISAGSDPQSGNTRLSINSSGFVGIGNNDAAAKLEITDGQVRISGTTAQALYLYGAATIKPYITLNQFGVGDFNIAVGQSASNTLSFTKTLAGTDGIIINSSGNVGVGISSSIASKLHIYDSASGSNITRLSFSCVDGGDIRVGKAEGVNNDAIFGTWSNNNAILYTNSTLRMQINNNGLIGINAAPSAWSGSPVLGRVLQIERASLFNYNNTTADLAYNIYFNGTEYKAIGTDGASMHRQNAGTHLFYVAKSTTAGNTVSLNEAVSIRTGGELQLAQTINLLSASNTETAILDCGIVVYRDRSNGGGCLVFYENGNINIVSQAGATVFTTSAPTATQIQLSNRAGNRGIQAIGGSSRNNVTLAYYVIRTEGL